MIRPSKNFVMDHHVVNNWYNIKKLATVVPSIVTPDIVTSLLISIFALAQVTNKLIKKNLSLVTSYSIFIITPFFLVPRGVTIKGIDCIRRKKVSHSKNFSLSQNPILVNLSMLL